MGEIGTGESEAMGELIPAKKFLKARFKGSKTDLCLYMLNLSQGTERKFSASFFRSRTYDQLVDFAARMSEEVGENYAVPELESL